jgi:hypothetical protein
MAVRVGLTFEQFLELHLPQLTASQFPPDLYKVPGADDRTATADFLL